MLTYLSVWMQNFFSDDEGAGAIEYGLIVGLIAAVIVAAFALFGDSLDGVFSAITGELDEAAAGVSGGSGT